MRNPIDPALALAGILALPFALGGELAAAQQPAPAAPPAAAAPAQPAAPAAPAAPGLSDSDIDAGKQISEHESLEQLAQALREGSEPMDADQVAALAVKTSPSVKAAQAANRRALEAASEALVAVYPRLDLEATYTRFSNITIPPMFGIPESAIPLNRYLFEARASVPLSDILLQILPRYHAAQEAATAQRLKAEATEEDIALQAREAFYNYARTRAALLVARSSRAQAEAQLKDVAALVTAGTLARVEQMRADAQVAAAQVAVARAEGAVAVARTALRSLLHLPGETDIALTERFGETLPALTRSQDQLLADALTQRKELRALRVMTKSNDLRIQAENGAKLPKLSVVGTVDYANPNQQSNPFEFEAKWDGSWTVVGALSWSPNDFAAASHRAGSAEADRAQTLADLQSLEDALRNEVAAAFSDYEASADAMNAALTGIRAAEEAYRVRREQFKAGAAVATDVVLAETEVSRSRLELINAAIDVRIARARLDRAVGQK
jgi:outer membrane protein TolC